MSSNPQTEPAAELFAGGGELGGRMLALDWSRTPLGPVETWPQSLKSAVSICLHSRFAIAVLWGPKFVLLYNQAYVQILGSRHPAALGSPGSEVWADRWDIIGPMLHGVMERGEATWSEDTLIPLERHGYVEESYFTFSYGPIVDESGGIGGIFVPITETTEKVIGERRLRTLRDLAAIDGGKWRNRNKVCEAAMQVLSANPYDVPCAAIYLFDQVSGDERICTRTAVSGTSGMESTGFPATISVRENGQFPWSKIARGETCVLDLTAGDLAVGQLGLLPQAPWDLAPVQAIAVPLVQSKAAEPIGLLLAGVSVRKRLDGPYREFYAQIAVETAGVIRQAEAMERERALRAGAERESLRIHELILCAPAAIATLSGPEHRYTLANGAYERLVGRTSKELMGRSVLEVFPELRGQHVLEILDEVYGEGAPFAGNELSMYLDITGSGRPTEVFYNFVYQPTRDANGKTDGIFVLAVDATEQVLARRELETREQQFRVLANSIPQLAWMANADGYTTWYNERWYAYTGTTLEQMRGWGWQAVQHPDFVGEAIAGYKRSIESGEPFNMTFPLRGADGTYHMFLTMARPVHDSSGAVVRWFGTNTDIEGQVRAEAALRQSEKLAAVGRLASSIAHEINNPLEAVTNLVYLASATAVNDDVKVFLTQAEHELDRVSQITSQTLRFHKQQSAPTPADLAELIDSVLILYRGKLSRDDIEVKVEMRDCPRLVCRAGEIRQVLANLIGNALDAMPRGGTLRIRLRPATDWRGHGSGIRVTIADTGVGMPADIRRHVYEPFYTTKGETGTGLGLWVTAGIVDKHGGSIHVRSKVWGQNAGRDTENGRRGTVFTVILPQSYSG